MSKRSRLFVYVLINIFISTVTVLFVLWVWEKSHPTPSSDQGSALAPVEEGSALQVNPESPTDQREDPQNALAFVTDDVQVSIHAIVGPGNLDMEYVEIHNQSQGAIDMTGWQITDQEGHIFVFPALILNQGGAVKVLSKKGNNTVIELYWQSDVPLWQSGETATLLKADGETVTTYSIP